MIFSEPWYLSANLSTEIAQLDEVVRRTKDPEAAYRLWALWSRAHGVPSARAFEQMKYAPGNDPLHSSTFPVSFTTLPELFLRTLERQEPTDVAALALWSRVSLSLPEVPRETLLQVAEREWQDFTWWKRLRIWGGEPNPTPWVSYLGYLGQPIDYSRDAQGRLSNPGPEGHQANFGLKEFLEDLKGREPQFSHSEWTKMEEVGNWTHITGIVPRPGRVAATDIGSFNLPIRNAMWSTEEYVRVHAILQRMAA